MRYIDYLTANNQSASVWDGQCKIDTGIAMTSSDIIIRIKFKMKYPVDGWTFCDRIVGYCPVYDYDSQSGSGYRLFQYSNGTFDANSRWINIGIGQQGQLYDLTICTQYIFDNIAGDMLVDAPTNIQVPSPTGTNIFIDVSWTEIYELTIQNNNGILLDGKPAVDNNGHIGLWDSVSESLIYNPDLDMYDPNPVDCTDCANWQECGYESYEDCQCQQYGECPPDCTDCNNWEDCGYESYDDCRCQQYGECPEPPEPERTRIVETIRNILTGMVDDESCELQSWQYNDMATSNVKLDNKKPSPTAVCYKVTDFEYDLRTGIRREKANVLVAFLQKENKLDAEGLEQDQIIKQMSDIAFEFLSKIMAEGSLRILNDKIKLKSTFLRSDSNRTGVVMELELEEKSGTCF